MRSRGQTTMELLILLAISMVALVIIYSLYATQLSESNAVRDSFLAQSSAQKIASAANALAVSGPGSETDVEIELPKRTNMSSSGFFGRTILFHLISLSDVFAVADVNLVGTLRANTGRMVLHLYYDGNMVHVSYNEFEFSAPSVVAAGVAGTVVQSSIRVRNNSSEDINLFVLPSFSSTVVSLVIPSGDLYATIDAGDSQQIDLNFVTTSAAEGNYAGYLRVTVSVADTNTVRTIPISVEVTKSA